MTLAAQIFNSEFKCDCYTYYIVIKFNENIFPSIYWFAMLYVIILCFSYFQAINKINQAKLISGVKEICWKTVWSICSTIWKLVPPSPVMFHWIKEEYWQRLQPNSVHIICVAGHIWYEKRINYIAWQNKNEVILIFKIFRVPKAYIKKHIYFLYYLTPWIT